MKKINYLSLGFLFLFCFSGDVLANSDLKQAQRKVEAARRTFQEMREDRRILFNRQEDELRFRLALMKLELAEQEIKGFAQKNSSETKLESALDEARFLKNLIMSYLAPGELNRYKIKKDRVDFNIQVGIDFELDQLMKRLPFLSQSGSKIQIHAGNSLDERASHMNRLRSEFYNALLRAAKLDSSDVELNALANWGKDTEYYVPYGKFNDVINSIDVVSFSEFNQLNLR